MKNVWILLTIIVLTACASAPSWKNMSESEISDWKSIDVSVEQVGKYVKAGLSQPQVKAWIDSGFTEQDSIIAWSQAKFKPKSAKEWRDINLTLETASKWQLQKFSPAEAQSWMNGGFNLDDAVTNRSKGLSPVK